MAEKSASKSKYEKNIDGSSSIYPHVCAMGVLATPEVELNVTDIFFINDAELPVVKRRNFLSSQLLMLPTNC